MHVGVGVVVNGHLEVEWAQNDALEGDHFLLRDDPLALAGHGGDLGGVDFIHFAGEEEQGQGDLLIVLFSDEEGFPVEAVEVGDRQVLRIPGDFLVVGEDPSDRVFSILIIDGIDGVGRVAWGVVGVCETGQRCAFL